MDTIRIVGGKPLQGTIKISGAKNAALPLMTVGILTDKPFVLRNVPKLADIKSMIGLMQEMGVEVEQLDSDGLCIQATKITSTTAPYDIVRKMRASILVLGPLLSRCGQAKVSLPGGCVIGQRPVDLHIKGLQEMGAKIELEDGYIIASAPDGLHGADISFPVVTVTGTENLMMAAALADGETKLINAAKEPEIVDLANCLNSMGAKISGAGTDTITIIGVESLSGTEHSVLPDRIETGSYIVAAAITNGELTLKGTSIDLLPSFKGIMEQAGVTMTSVNGGIHVKRSNDHTRGIDITTDPYPGYPTDIQAQAMALMALSEGTSVVTENIFENRFMHVPELCRMGADIKIHSNTTAIVKGVDSLLGAPVMATDIRASMSLVLAGLAAEGETNISRVYHLDRGYADLEDKLQACGAEIERLPSN